MKINNMNNMNNMNNNFYMNNNKQNNNYNEISNYNKNRYNINDNYDYLMNKLKKDYDYDFDYDNLNINKNQLMNSENNDNLRRNIMNQKNEIHQKKIQGLYSVFNDNTTHIKRKNNFGKNICYSVGNKEDYLFNDFKNNYYINI